MYVCMELLFLAQRLPDADTLQPSNRWPEERIKWLKHKQQRLAAYRSVTFWAHPDISRGVRRPLPSCVYMYIRALFPPTDNEEEFADFNFSIYIPEATNNNWQHLYYQTLLVLLNRPPIKTETWKCSRVLLHCISRWLWKRKVNFSIYISKVTKYNWQHWY